jgi:transcriptional regulator with GAF, ATPase, and Fis domain
MPDEAKAFVDINIAALSAEIAERELFGNERGAYTGADARKPGYFELANHGTLFLDEIGDADLDLQKKLLKVLEHGKFYRLGGKEVFHSTFKLICATHRDLKKTSI